MNASGTSSDGKNIFNNVIMASRSSTGSSSVGWLASPLSDVDDFVSTTFSDSASGVVAFSSPPHPVRTENKRVKTSKIFAGEFTVMVQ